MFHFKRYIKHKWKYSKLGRFIKYGYLFREYSDLEGMILTVLVHKGREEYNSQLERFITTRGGRRKFREAIEIAEQLLKGTAGDSYQDMRESRYPIEDIIFEPCEKDEHLPYKDCSTMVTIYKGIDRDDERGNKIAEAYRSTTYRKQRDIEQQFSDRLFHLLKHNLHRWWS